MTERSARHEPTGRPDVVQHALAGLLRDLRAGSSGPLHVVDIGGGSGTVAVRVAAAGHRVTVVDPSPDALATLRRRAADAGVATGVVGVQGDAVSAPELLGASCADLVLCHGVLEVVDDPAAAVRGLRELLRPEGRLSVVVSQRLAAVLARARGGHLADAERLLTDAEGRWGAGDPLPRRFDEPGLVELLRTAGLTLVHVTGLRTVTDAVPATVRDDPGHADALARLDDALSHLESVRAIAPLLHVVAAPARS